MASYKFRAYYEEDDGIYRDIRIASAQGFTELQEVLQTAFELPKGTYTVKFYKSNDSWQRIGKYKTELTREVEERKKKVTVQVPVLLQQIVDDPHLRMIGLYQSDKNEIVLLLELIQIIVKDDPKLTLPAIVGSQGPSPFKEDEVKKYLTAKAGDKLEELLAYSEEDGDDDEEGTKKSSDGDSEDSDDEDSDEETADEEGMEGSDSDKYDVF